MRQKEDKVRVLGQQMRGGRKGLEMLDSWSRELRGNVNAQGVCNPR